MARSKRKNVDYFPCYCKDGKVLFILESRWGNNGYAFFYKLWKRLGDADYHYIDLRPFDNWEYFRAKMGISDTETKDILDKLSEMGVIDPELWGEKIVWSDSFIESVADVWIKRNQLIPQKPLFLIQKPTLPEQSGTETPISDNQNPQSKVNKSKVNKRTLCVYSDAFQSFWNSYPKKTAKKGAFAEWNKAEDTGQLPSIDAILSAIENQKRARQKAHDTGQFTSEWPDPERWIKKARWEDDPEALIGKQGGNGNKPPPGKTYQSTVIADPFTVCPKCNSEVLKSNFIEINGNRYCSKCPEVAAQAKKTLSKLTEMAQGIGGKV